MPETSTSTERIRNVVLLGHGSTGKTKLAECLLELGGVDVGRGGFLDFEPEEQQRGYSLGLAVASVLWRGHRINLLDTPGSADAIGDAYPALLAADLALFVVDASAGLQPQHDQLWAACEELGMPRMIVLNKLDRPQAAYQSNVDDLHERYGNALAPVHMPLGVEEEFTGIIDLLNFNAVEFGDSARREVAVPEDREEQAEANRELLVEAIVEQSDELLMEYLEGEIPEASRLAAVFAQGIASGGFFPVLCASAERGIGTQLLADFIVDQGPAPDPIGEEASLVVAKTLSDPYVGRINVLRLLGGVLQADDVLNVRRTGDKVRLHQLFRLNGQEQTPVGEVQAGDVVAVAKLDDVTTGDVLTTNGVAFEPKMVAPPEPYYRVALQPASAGDEDKLSSTLARISEEDPSLRVVRDTETNQLVVAAFGPAHLDVAQARMQRKFGVAVTEVPLRIAYRETAKGTASGIGKHVKQSGGHGQYGIAHVEVEPLPADTGFEFVDRIVGGVIPRQFIGSVEKGIVDAMTQGVVAGYPVVDVKVTLFDGKHHSVDSSDMAFQMAGSLAFRDAAQNAGMVLLEPVDEVVVEVPESLTGDVMGDLSSRRGRIQGSGSAGYGRATVTANVPRAELVSYAAELRSLTRGAGTVRIRPDHYERVPDHVAERVIAQAREDEG